MYKQGHLVKLKSPSLLPDGKTDFHPFLIISSIDIASYERSHIAVMMTSSAFVTKLSFPCPQASFEGYLKPNSHLQMHIVQMIREENIEKVINCMKKIDLQIFLEQFKSKVFKLD